MAEFGYIQIEFDLNFRKSLQKWCEDIISPHDCVFGVIDGEEIGGIVANKAHITICYGIAGSILIDNQINKEIKKIILPNIRIKNIGYFSVPDYHAKIIYLSICDDEILKSINEQFKKYISPKLKEIKPFIPHITLAYVSESFVNEKLSYQGQKVLFPVSIKYYKK